jgi:hypothetical protein
MDLLVDLIKILDTKRLLWIMLQWTWKYRYIFGILILILLYISRNGIAGSYDNYSFSFSWNLHPHCHFAVIIYIPLSLCSCSLLDTFLSTYLFHDILKDLKYYIVVVLLFISLMISGVECLFLNLLTICVFTEEKALWVLCSLIIYLVLVIDCLGRILVSY